MTTSSFNPPIRTLLGPGPSSVHPRVLAAAARPTIGHLDPVFALMMEELKELLRYAFQTRNALTIPISGPGSAGMETCFVNLIEPGDKVIICRNGVFGERMRENAERCGGVPIMVDDEWGRPVDVNKVEEVLKKNTDIKIIACVHAETSTGAKTDIEAITELAIRYNCLTIVDAVTSLGGIPVRTDEWQIDAIYSGTQKCLSCPPGLSPLSISERAAQKIKNRKSKVQSWFLDLTLVMEYWGGENRRTYHHTAPVNSLYSLHEALLLLREEGLENAWNRHYKHHCALKAGLEAMGLKFLVAPETAQLPQLNAVQIPAGADDLKIRQRLLQEFNLEIGGGLGPLAGKVWRIGLMGHSSDINNVLYCLGALETLLSENNTSIARGQALTAAMSAFASNS